MQKSIHIYTDGSCLVDRGLGGWSVVSEDFIFYGRCSNTTNNEMEIYAIWKAISHANMKYEKIEIYSDSEYAINIFTKWAYDWESRNWQKRSKGQIKNLDLIKRIFEITKDNSAIRFHKVKSHSGDEMNDLADKFAYEMMNSLK